MEKNSDDKRSFFKSVRNYFREYCNYSSIHGFRYIGEKRTHFERFWWLVAISCTIALCIFTISVDYRRWLNSPIIVSFATRDTPIFSIPFPAVTICSESKSRQSRYSHMNLSKKLIEKQKLTDNEIHSAHYMDSFCDLKLRIPSSSDDREYLENFIETVENITAEKFQIMGCSFIDEGCEFKPIITDEGICYTFNMLDRSEIYNENVQQYSSYHEIGDLTHQNWTIENGYASTAGMNPYPRRALMTGFQNGLTLLLLTKKTDIDHVCKRSMQGHRVLLHLPSRIPMLSQEYFRVPLNSVVLTVVNPTMITTSETVKNYSPAGRGCYLTSERPLRYFKFYSTKNCYLECLTNYTMSHCGCVAHFMPRDENMKICGPAKNDCMYSAGRNYQLYELNKTIETSRNENVNSSGLNCDCLPMCSDLSYNPEISQDSWNVSLMEKELFGLDVNSLSDIYFVSKLTISFKSSSFITTQRHEFYGPTDFLANFGGLLGLFTGVSVLSLMEAIYFLTVRIICNSRLYGYWAGQN